MTYMLDTHAVSALMKGDPQVAAKLRAANRGDISIPQPVIAEIAYGIERLPRSNRRQVLRERLELVCMELPRAEWTDTVSERFGLIKATLEHKGNRIEDFDAAIAAHALASGATLVTANLADMVRVPGLKVVDWASGEA